MNIEKGARILFTGDSITDACRDRNDFNSLSSFSKMVSDYIAIFHPELNITVMNRGIGGFRSVDLDRVMDTDLKDTKPTIVTILIGINDVWRKYDSNSETTIEEYVANVKSIIKKVKKYTDKIILIEPFTTPTDPQKDKFRNELNPEIDALRKIAREEKTEYIPMDGIFAEKWINSDPAVFSGDSVHPTHEGGKVIASEWLKRVTFENSNI